MMRVVSGFFSNFVFAMYFLMKFFSLLFCLFLCTDALFAAPLDSLTARSVALRWFSSGMRTLSSDAEGELLSKEYPGAYCFTLSRDFVLVAKDTELPAVLGYGSVADTERMPAALQAMLQNTTLAAYPPVGASWTAVEPLLTTIRHQEAPYNAACPYYKEDDGTVSENRCVVGCVATAMEQIMTYHRRNYVLQDTLHGWSNEHYEIPDVLPGSSVDSRLIRDDYATEDYSEAELDAVARLSYYLGVACQMNWGTSESGAYSYKLVEPLQRAFGMGYVNYLDSYKYAPVAYWNYLASEIMAHRPVYYAGSVMRTGGHAFVLDGLSADGLFHVNWGYGGSYDGYFRLDVLAHPQPESDRRTEFVESGFFCNQEAITFSPDPLPDVLPPDTLDRTGREVEIERMWLGDEPVSDCYTRVYLAVHNTSEQALTTPFALILNELTDTARFEQAQWLAYSGRTLEAGERDTLLVRVRFLCDGERLLSVTPDGEQILDSLLIDIAPGGEKYIETAVPQIAYVDETTVDVTQLYTNPSATERASQVFVYDLKDNVTGSDGQIEHCIYIAPGGDFTETVRFRQLVPGRSYTLRLRRVWSIVESVDFEMLPSLAVDEVKAADPDAPITWFSLDGRQVKCPASRGVYLKRQGGTVSKVFVP